jgi:hypothetical protein
LTGQTATATSGTLTQSVAQTAQLTGNTSAFSTGQATPSLTVALAGNTSAFSAGTLSVGGDITVALLGNSSTFSAGTLSVQPVVGDGKSHTNLYVKQLLTEYYEQAFKKPEVVELVAKAKVPKPGKKLPDHDDVPQIDKLIEKAEKVLSNKSNVDVANLVETALKFNLLVTDFNDFAKKQRDKENQELLLFSLVL